jgi:hypothetical protein
VFWGGVHSFVVFNSSAAANLFIRSGLFTPTGRGTAEVPVLRLRQAFWLAAVVRCKPERYHSVNVFLRRLFVFSSLSFSPFSSFRRRMFIGINLYLCL